MAGHCQLFFPTPPPALVYNMGDAIAGAGFSSVFFFLFWWLLWTSINGGPVLNSFRPPMYPIESKRDAEIAIIIIDGKELLISKVPFIYVIRCCFWGFPSVVDNNSDLLATRPWRIISPAVAAVRSDPTQRERETPFWWQSNGIDSLSPPQHHALLQNTVVYIVIVPYLYLFIFRTRLRVGFRWLRLFRPTAFRVKYI